MKYAFFNDDCYNLYTITTTKFESSKFEIVFVSDLSLESLTYLNLLSYVLLDSTKTYKTNKEFLRKLEFLYDSKINISTTRVGNSLLTSLSIDYASSLFSDETEEEIIKLAFDVINNPLAAYNSFDEEVTNKCKRKALNDILLLNDDKKGNALINALKKTDDIRGMNIYGNVDILNSITEKKLFKFYNNFLENSLKNIYYIGNKNEKVIKKLIQKYQKFNSIQTKKFDLFLDDDLSKMRLKNYKGSPINGEVKIVQIYSFSPLSEFEANYVVPVFNSLLAAGSQDSLVFKKLRENEGMTYGIDSFYQKYDKILILNTMCKEKNYKLALRIIKSCIDDIKRSKFSSETLDSAKNLLLTSYNFIYDDLGAILENYVFNTIFNVSSLDEKKENVTKVTKKDVVNVAKKIKLVVNYVGGE